MSDRNTHREWLEGLGDPPSVAASKAGLTHTRLLRQLEKNALSPDVVIALARAYKIDTIQALYETGHLTDAEITRSREDSLISRAFVKQALDMATNADILEQIQKRMDDGNGEVFNEPATLPVHPLKTKKDIPITDKRGFLTAEAAAVYAVAADSSPIEPEPGDEGYGA